MKKKMYMKGCRRGNSIFFIFSFFFFIVVFLEISIVTCVDSLHTCLNNMHGFECYMNSNTERIHMLLTVHRDLLKNKNNPTLVLQQRLDTMERFEEISCSENTKTNRDEIHLDCIAWNVTCSQSYVFDSYHELYEIQLLEVVQQEERTTGINNNIKGTSYTRKHKNFKNITNSNRNTTTTTTTTTTTNNNNNNNSSNKNINTSSNSNNNNNNSNSNKNNIKRNKQISIEIYNFQPNLYSCNCLNYYQMHDFNYTMAGAENYYNIQWSVPCWLVHTQTLYKIEYTCIAEDCGEDKGGNNIERSFTFHRGNCKTCEYMLKSLLPCKKYEVCLVMGKDQRSRQCFEEETVCSPVTGPSQQTRAGKQRALSIELTTTVVLCSVIVVVFSVTVLIIKLKGPKYPVETIRPRQMIVTTAEKVEFKTLGESSTDSNPEEIEMLPPYVEIV